MTGSEDKVIVIDPSQHAAFEYFVRLRKHDDALAIVVKGHLFVEYLLNQIIRFKCKAPTKILNNPRNFTFAVKLQILYSMDLLPDHVQKNIAKLNKLRNELAHNLEVNIKKSEMTMYRPGGRLVKISPRGQRNPDRYFLRMFCHQTLWQLTDYMQSELKLSGLYDQPTVTLQFRESVSRVS